MTARTRTFVIASLTVLTVGLGMGLLAYFVGLPTGAFTRQAGPDELRFVPHDAVVVAFANVQEVMQSDVRQRLRRVLPSEGEGQRQFAEQTGINIEMDIDRVVAALSPVADAADEVPAGVVLARGRFDAVKIENLMRDHGARVDDYRGTRLVQAEHGPRGPALSLAFIEPGLVALGSTHLVRHAIDLREGSGASVTSNDAVMEQIQSVEGGNTWAVGRLDALSGRLPVPITDRLPAITWFAVSADINGGLRTVLRAETRDEEAAANLREVVQGFVALAKMQFGSRPEVQTLTRSLELGGTGTTVALSFEVPAELFDMIGAAAPPPAQ